MMKKILKLSFYLTYLSSSIIVQLALFAVSVALIFALSYIIGYRYLLGDTLWGNDAFSYFSVVYWIDKYYPNLPFWFPLQGGGVSFAGYPWLAAYVVNIIARFSPLDLVQSYRLLGFLSIPLTGVGIFLYAWARLIEVRPIWMRQVIGIVAALFYVVSPLAWMWLVKWGFYAEHVSHIFVPIAILFFDLYIERLFSKKRDFLYRMGFVGTLVFWLLAFLTHFFAGVSIILAFLILIFVKFVFFKENRIRLAKRVLPSLIMFGILFAGLFIFRYLPYSTYNKAVAEGGFIGYAPGDRQGVFNNTLTWEMMLSLKDPKFAITDYRAQIKDFKFQFYVWLLVIPSLLFAFFKSKKIFAFSVATLIGFFINTNVDLKMSLAQIPFVSTFVGMFLTGRAFFISARLFIPIAAAFGAYVVWEILFSSAFHFIKKSKYLYYSLYPIKVFMVLFLTLVTVFYVVTQYSKLPYEEPYMVNAGAFDGKLDLRDIWHRVQVDDVKGVEEKNMFVRKNPKYFSYEWIADFVAMNNTCRQPSKTGAPLRTYPESHICSYFIKRQFTNATVFPPMNLVQNAKKNCDGLKKEEFIGHNTYCKAYYSSILDQLVWENWYKEEISKSIEGEILSALHMFDSLPKGKEYRYDISGFSGRQIMIAPLVSTNSQLQVYINTLSLIYNSWNYLGQIMYTVFPLYQKPGAITELGKWFGLDYVYLAGSGLEPFEYWKTDSNWQRVTKGDENGAGWRKFKLPTGITTWDDRPKMLAISDNKKFFYDQTFRFFTWGGLYYDQAIPVIGKKEIDAYSSKELKQYDMIFMRGYGYKWKWNAYRMLNDYVKNGGKLIFDTGWQYYVPDYKLDSTPGFMPFDKLQWKNLDTKSKYVIEHKTIAKDVNPDKLGPLTWENTSWGVSVPVSLKEWAEPVLSYDGKPLIVVGKYGKGKVAWIGFNIIPHAEAKDSLEEVKLFNRLITYLNDDYSKPKQYKVEKKRISPDSVEFLLKSKVDQPSNLYFRESYYSDWNAKLISKNGNKKLTIRKAGPGFMLIDLPKIDSGDKIALKIKKQLKQSLAEATSLATMLGVLIYLIYPEIFKLLLFKIKNKLNFRKLSDGLYRKLMKERISKTASSWKMDEDEDY